MSRVDNQRMLGDAQNFSDTVSTLGNLAGVGIGKYQDAQKYNFKLGDGTIDRSMVDSDVARIESYEETNPGLSLNGNKYDMWAGWTDPASGITYN